MNSLSRNLAFITTSLTLSVAGLAQSGDPVIITVDGKPVTRSEFESVYKKNNGKDISADKKSVRDYLDLFINFKLKVKEAEQQGLDTLQSFRDELSGYRKQLAAPYLTDKNVNESLIQEAYERTKTEVRASHILVRCLDDALPKDTIVAYNKAIEFRKRILGGEDFAKVARESAIEGDPSAKENGGDLGYFTALQMIYPFESMAYSTKVGDVSMPVRTSFGYHIIKVQDKRPNQGEVLVAHIMVRLNKESKSADSTNAAKKITEIYEKLKAGESFESLASQYSEDKQSAGNGGQLNWYGAGKMPVPEFEKPCFSLKANGDYTAPFATRYGWHIVKRLDKKELPSYESMRTELKQKVSKDSRSRAGRTALVAKVKKEYGFKENKTQKGKISSFPALDEYYTIIDSSYFKGKWTAERAKGWNKELFSLNGKKYTQEEFSKFLESHQTRRSTFDVKYIVEQQYQHFVEENCVAYEESRLEAKYPDFKNLLQEYRDGILLFDLTDRKVWSKAVKDTTGLKEYYEKNKNNYLWDERANVTTYKCANDKVAKEVRKLLEKHKSTEEIKKALGEKSQLDLSVETVMYLKGENKMIDDNWKMGLSGDIKKDGMIYILDIDRLLPKSPKTLNEAKGMVTADYQNYLEKEWLSNLKTNHKVEVKEEVLNTIK